MAKAKSSRKRHPKSASFSEKQFRKHVTHVPNALPRLLGVAVGGVLEQGLLFALKRYVAASYSATGFAAVEQETGFTAERIKGIQKRCRELADDIERLNWWNPFESGLAVSNIANSLPVEFIRPMPDWDALRVFELFVALPDTLKLYDQGLDVWPKSDIRSGSRERKIGKELWLTMAAAIVEKLTGDKRYDELATVVEALHSGFDAENNREIKVNTVGRAVSNFRKRNPEIAAVIDKLSVEQISELFSRPENRWGPDLDMLLRGWWIFLRPESRPVISKVHNSDSPESS